MLLLDHVFVCVSDRRPELVEMRKLGFVADFSRVHPGQGTANEVVVFEGNYLEFLYLRDRAEAEANELRLDRRVDHHETGASPFGVALRGDRSALGAVSWRPYRLEGMTAPIHILAQSLDDPSLPVVFCFDDAAPASGGPRRWGLEPDHFAHACGAGSIVEVRVEGPGVGRLDALALPSEVRLIEGEVPRMRVRLDRGPTHARVGALLELVAG